MSVVEDKPTERGKGNHSIAAAIVNPPHDRQIGQTGMFMPHLGEKLFCPLQGHRWFEISIPVHGCIQLATQ
jgi:hypothetical protein